MTCQKIPYPTREAALADIRHIKINMRYRSKKHAGAKKSNRKMRAYHLEDNVNEKNTKGFSNSGNCNTG